VSIKETDEFKYLWHRSRQLYRGEMCYYALRTSSLVWEDANNTGASFVTLTIFNR